MKSKVILIFLILFFAFAQYWGLVRAPADRMMGDVYRILFVHVPAAWNALLLLTVSFVGCLLYLLRRKEFWDRLAHSSMEIGLVLTGLVLPLGSLWAKPTWGVWWTWDPRLTTTMILFILYAGVLILRQLIDDPVRRAKISSAVGLLIYLNVPIVYLSVRWWRSLHQLQSSPSTMDPQMVLALRLNAFALLGLAVFFLVQRMRLLKREALIEEKESLPPPLPRGAQS
ncbi:MAG: cytochrome c biogenesis protein CcsA [Deltaproteobacteria bacterium]|nr:cytochrome c biogenesis protein CcsA [Deltaproteobacteria bacterium]